MTDDPERRDMHESIRALDEAVARLPMNRPERAAESEELRESLHRIDALLRRPDGEADEAARPFEGERDRLIDRFATLLEEEIQRVGVEEIPLAEVERRYFLAMADTAESEHAREQAAALAANAAVFSAAEDVAEFTISVGAENEQRPLRELATAWVRGVAAAETAEERHAATMFLAMMLNVSIVRDTFWVMAQRMVAMLEEEAGLLAALDEAQREVDTRQRRPAPLAIRDERYWPASTEHAYYEVARGLSQPARWHRDEATGWPTLTLASKDVSGHIQLVPVAIDAEAYRAPEERAALEAAMWRHCERMSEYTRKVLRAVEVLWKERSRMNPETEVLIGVDEILDEMEKKPKTGEAGRRSGHRVKDRRRVVDELAKIEAVQLRVTATMTERGRGGKTRRVERQFISRLFTMKRVAAAPDKAGSSDTLVVRVKPDGQYAHALLTSAHAPYDRRLLTENPRTHGPVIALVEAFVQDWRRNGGAYRARNYFGLLQEIGVPPRRYPSEEIERAEAWMEHMLRQGYVASIEWQNFEPADAYGRGATQKLQAASWLVEPPEYTRATLDGIGRKRRSTRQAPTSPLASRITAARTTLRLTQAQAAEDAGVPQQTFSRAERGLNVAADTRRKLESWLSRVAPASA